MSNFCRREYTMTVHAIKKQLSSRNKESLALHRWTSANKLAIRSVITYYMDWNWALWEVQLVFDEVNSWSFFYFESSLPIRDQESTYTSKASHTFEWRSGSFWADWRPFNWNYNWLRIIKLLDDSWIPNYTSLLRNRVAHYEKPHTMNGTHYSACFGCIEQQSRSKRPHKVLGSA